MSQYLTSAEFRALNLPSDAIEEVTDEQLDGHLTLISGRIDAYIDKLHALPISAPYPDILVWIAGAIATWHILLWRGFNPEHSGASGYKAAHDEAHAALVDIASGKLQLPGVVDATPGTSDGWANPIVVTSAKRGW